jgi:hypothetical protein
MQTMTAGTVLAIYDEKLINFDGAEPIARAEIKRVEADKSLAAVLGVPKRALTIRDKVVVVSQDFGTLRLKFLLEGEDAAKIASARDKAVLQTLRKAFSPLPETVGSSGVDIVSGKWKDARARWDVALLKDAFGKVFPNTNLAVKSSNQDDKLPSPEKQIFYLAGKDFVPLFGFFVEPDKPDAAEKIQKVLVHLARLRTVKAISNAKTSPELKNKITVRPVRLINPRCPGNVPTVFEKREELIPTKSGTYKLNSGDRFWIEVENNSEVPLFMNLIVISTNGSVAVDPRQDLVKTGFRVEGKSKQVFPGYNCQKDSVLRAAKLPGWETYKIIATTEEKNYKDFQYLEMDAVQRNEIPSIMSFGDWTTADAFVEIIASKQ